MLLGGTGDMEYRGIDSRVGLCLFRQPFSFFCCDHCSVTLSLLSLYLIFWNLEISVKESQIEKSFRFIFFILNLKSYMQMFFNMWIYPIYFSVLERSTNFHLAYRNFIFSVFCPGYLKCLGMKSKCEVHFYTMPQCFEDILKLQCS